MKKLVLFLSLLVGGLTISCHSDNDNNIIAPGEDTNVSGTFNVDPYQSTITWHGYKLVESSITGHVGNLTLNQGGTFDLKEGILTAAKFSTQTSTLTAIDLEEGPERDKLLTHLKSADFLGIDEFPEASFNLISTKKLKGDSKYNTTLRGILKIKDVEKDITMKANLYTDGKWARIDTEKLTLNRKEFHILFDFPTTEIIVTDNFNLQVNIVGSIKK